MMKRINIFMRPGDWIVIVILCALCLSSFLIISYQNTGEIVEIFHNDQRINQIPLHLDTELKLQGTMSELKVIIQDKKVWVQESGCPNKTCMKMGKISKSGQSIICLPNQILIAIKGDHQPKYDSVTK